jgi:hypothetical protein
MGRPPSPTDVQIEYIHRRPPLLARVLRVVAIAGIALGAVLLLGAFAVFALAYERQSDRIEELQEQNASILGDHHAIGAQFADQSKRFAEESKKLEEAIESSYGRGYLAGREAASLPKALRPLAGLAASDVLVPRQIPEAAGVGPRVRGGLNGYTIRWPRVAVFASRDEAVSTWTRQALGRRVRMRVGGQRVERTTGPGGVMFVWRTGGVTYAVIATPRLEPAARALIASMK